MRLHTLALGTLAATAVTLGLAGTASAATPMHRDHVTVRCDRPDYQVDPDERGPHECRVWRTEPRRTESRTLMCDPAETAPAEPARPRLAVPAEPAAPGLVLPAIPRDR